MTQQITPRIFDNVRNGGNGVFPARGVTFIDRFDDAIRALREGDDVDFVLEPDNEYDAYAVRIEKEGVFLGFMPKEINQAYHEELSRGHQWYGEIVYIYYDESGYNNSGLRIAPVYGGSDGDISGNEPLIDVEENKFSGDALQIRRLTRSGVFSNEADASEFFDFVHENFGYPDSDDPYDAVSAARIGGAANFLHSNFADLNGIVKIGTGQWTDVSLDTLEQVMFDGVTVLAGEETLVLHDRFEAPIPWDDENQDSLVARIVKLVFEKALIGTDNINSISLR